MGKEWQVKMMAVYLAALIAALFYLSAVPVRAGAAWKNGESLRVGITVGPFRFSARGDVKYTVENGLIASLTHDKNGIMREFSFLRSTADRTAKNTRMKDASRALKYLFSHVRPYQLRARLHFALPDAARNAFLYGIANILFSTLRAVRPDLPLTASVSADFHSGQTQLAFSGILSCRLGHIMAAALVWLRDSLGRRLQTWITNNRSKAS